MWEGRHLAGAYYYRAELSDIGDVMGEYQTVR